MPLEMTLVYITPARPKGPQAGAFETDQRMHQ